jgi:hypothetical protein
MAGVFPGAFSSVFSSCAREGCKVASNTVQIQLVRVHGSLKIWGEFDARSLAFLPLTGIPI